MHSRVFVSYPSQCGLGIAVDEDLVASEFLCIVMIVSEFQVSSRRDVLELVRRCHIVLSRFKSIPVLVTHLVNLAALVLIG